jgi:hypothetical protein
MLKFKPISFWKPIKPTKIKLKPLFTPIKLSQYPARTKSEWRLIDKNPFGDRDRDRVPNIFDCKPLNKKKQSYMLRQDIKRRLGLDMTRKELRQERLLGKKLLKKKMYVSNTPHKKQSTEDIISFFEKNPHMIKTAELLSNKKKIVVDQKLRDDNPTFVGAMEFERSSVTPLRIIIPHIVPTKSDTTHTIYHELGHVEDAQDEEGKHRIVADYDDSKTNENYSRKDDASEKMANWKAEQYYDERHEGNHPEVMLALPEFSDEYAPKPEALQSYDKSAQELIDETE